VTPLVIGLDASTTACKAIVTSPTGTIESEGRATYGLANPGPDAWEQRAEDWALAARDALREAIRSLPAKRRSAIAAMAIANQRETFVVTDDAGKSLAPAIVWMDARCRPEVKAACTEMDADRIHAISGKVPCVTPSLYKIRALVERLRPDIRKHARRVFDVHGFLAFHLTGENATSTASADPLGLVDMVEARWSDELVSLAKIDKGLLPRLVGPGEVLGTLRADVASDLGLDRPIPLVSGAGDGQAAGLGAGVASEETAYLNLGTAIVSGKPSLTYRTSRAFRTLFAAVPGSYLLETDLKGGTFTLDWLADRLLGGGALAAGKGRDEVLADLEERASVLSPGASGLMALPYWAGVMNPHWDDDASGALVGLRGDHGPEHVYRAILEGIAMEQRLHTEAVEAAAGPIATLIAVGGGARRGLFAQIVADVMGRTLVRPRAAETTALGAAILATVGAGLHPSALAAAEAMTSRGDTIAPSPNLSRYEHLYRSAFAHLYGALAPVLRALAEA
jgi:xylulokinase